MLKGKQEIINEVYGQNKERNMSNKDTLAGLGIGIGVGLLIGGALGLLYAPKEGKETRQLIRDKAGKFAKEVRLCTGRAKISDIK